MTNPADQSNDVRRHALARLAGSLLVAAAAVAMLAWTWFKWPDPVVDFGRELYVAWQLAEGKVLYRDVAYFNGPLSPYVNALVMRLLGVSLQSIVVANLVVLALVIAMVWRLWVTIADALAATLACLMLVGVFAFIQLGGIANYNFVTPYSHELTHGIALTLAAMLCVSRFASRPNSAALAGAGLLLGLVFLTKAEVFVAAAAALSAGVMGALLATRASARRVLRGLAQFGLSALAPPVVTLLLLVLVMPPSEALRGVLGSWAYVFDTRISGMRFYQRILGTLDPGNNVGSMVESFVWWGALFGSVAAIGTALRRRQHPSDGITKPTDSYPWAFMIALIACLALMWFIQHRFDILWNQAFRGLSLVLLATTVGLVALFARRARDASNPPDRRLVMQLVVATFALLLLGKMFLNVLLLHYGFALAMPATLVTVALVASWWPNAIDRAGGTGAVLRATAVSAVGLVLYIHLHFFHMLAAEKVTLVGTGPDAFWADAVVRDARGDRHEFDHRGRAVNHVLDALSKLPRGATLAAVPEGTMINYLSRRPNPTPYMNLMPPEVLMFGQQRILRAYQQRPPDYIVLVLKSDPADYGYKSFARDYGEEIYRWIEGNYVQVPAPTEPTYPMVLLERK